MAFREPNHNQLLDTEKRVRMWISGHEVWEDEINGIIKDVQDHVKHIGVSSKLTPELSHLNHLNLTTLEDKEYCIMISTSGYRIVGDQHDTISSCNSEIYESPYDLLNQISPMYRQSFSEAVLIKLEALQEDRKEKQPEQELPKASKKTFFDV